MSSYWCFHLQLRTTGLCQTSFMLCLCFVFFLAENLLGFIGHGKIRIWRNIDCNYSFALCQMTWKPSRNSDETITNVDHLKLSNLLFARFSQFNIPSYFFMIAMLSTWPLHTTFSPWTPLQSHTCSCTYGLRHQFSCTRLWSIWLFDAPSVADSSRSAEGFFCPQVRQRPPFFPLLILHKV